MSSSIEEIMDTHNDESVNKRKRDDQEDVQHVEPEVVQQVEQEPQQKKQKPNKSIVLFIQAHGSESDELTEADLREINNNIRLLSFSGEVDICGRMALNPTTKLSVDSKLIQILHENYFNDRTNKKGDDEEIAFMESNAQQLKEMYENDYKIKYHREAGKFTHEGFTTFPVQRERTFYFRGNPGENPAYVGVRNYGLSVLRSDDSADCEFTLENIVLPNPPNLDNYKYQWTYDQIKELSGRMKRCKANLHKNKNSRLHWVTKFLSNLQVNSIDEAVRPTEILTDLFDKDNPHIKLSDLYYFFNTMGFTKIFIYDPTCRSVDTSQDVKTPIERFKRAYQRCIDHFGGQVGCNEYLKAIKIKDYNYEDLKKETKAQCIRIVNRVNDIVGCAVSSVGETVGCAISGGKTKKHKKKVRTTRACRQRRRLRSTRKRLINR